MDFKIWEKTVESTQTIEVNRDVIRDIYPMPNGINLMQDIGMPRHIFAKQWQRSVVMFTLPESKKKLVEMAGGEFSDDYYTEDGYGTPVFCGENSLEKAYTFASILK